MSDQTALITRATIDQIVARRGEAVSLYEEAFEALSRANKVHALATQNARSEAPRIVYGAYSRVEHFDERGKFLDRTRKEIDRGIWRYLVETTRMETLMDHKAREEFRRQLEEDPPEVTVETCYATLSQLIEDSPTIFRRGVAEAFSNLDRRFRSHDGFKIGARICLTYPTPVAVGKTVLERLGLGYRRVEDQGLSVLEPSAGDGRLARLAIEAGCPVTCVELHPGRAGEMRWSKLYQRVVEADFLELTPDSFGRFDRVMMNPPFDRGLDMDHVRHAFEFLAPGGILCSVMSAGTAYREDSRTEAFRAWAKRFVVDRWTRDTFEDLPRGSFAESGTMVNACLLTLQKPE